MLRAILGTDIAQVVDRIDELSALVSGPVVDMALIDTYRAALARALSSDPWMRLLGHPDQGLNAGFAPRRVVHCPGGTRPERAEAVDLDVAAAACDRLVVLGGPGMGKTWAAMHLAGLACSEPGSVILRCSFGPPPSSTGRRASRCGRRRYARTRWSRWPRRPAWPRARRCGAGSPGTARTSWWWWTGWTRPPRGRRRHARPAGAARAPGADRGTSRPGAWKNQLRLDPVRDRLSRTSGGAGGHAVVDLESLSAAEVVRLVEANVPNPEARQRLLTALEDDTALAEMACTPLLCVMLCALEARGEGRPANRTALVSMVVTQLVRASWRSDRPVTDDVLDAAHQVLGAIALDAAADDRDTDLGAWPTDITPLVPSDLPLDAILPPVGNQDPFRAARCGLRAPAGVVRLLATHLAEATAAKAAVALRHHLWFDDDWHEVMPAVLALHPHRSEVLRALLDAGPGDDLGPLAARLDGFGEIHRLLASLALRTPAADWSDPGCRT